MNKLIIPILILIFTSCSPGHPNCDIYYFYSEQHLNQSLKQDPNYVTTYVEGRLYTGQADTKVAYNLYHSFWPDTKVTYIGCPDTLHFRNLHR